MPDSAVSTAPLPLDASGERYIPTMMQRDVEVEHWHRYLIASRLVAGKRVLDIASGEGYGSSLLARTAASVVGVDISADAVQHASEAYRGENLRFLTGSCAAIPLADASVDAVISFETLEHHDLHEEMFAEIKRVLVPGGLCVMSTPDRIVYSEIPNYANPYHVKELTAREFEDLVGRHFAHQRILGQKFLLGSIVTGTEEGLVYFRQDDFRRPPQELPLAPKYLIALASDGDLPKVAASVLETAGPDAEEARLNGLLKELAAQLEANKIEKQAYVAAALDRQRERDDAEARLNGLVKHLSVHLEANEIEKQAHIAAARDRQHERDDAEARLNGLLKQLTAQIEANEIEKQALVAAAADRQREHDDEVVRLNGLVKQLAAQIEAVKIEKQAYIGAAADRQRERDDAETRFAAAVQERNALAARLATAVAQINGSLWSKVRRHLFKKPRVD